MQTHELTLSGSQIGPILKRLQLAIIVSVIPPGGGHYFFGDKLVLHCPFASDRLLHDKSDMAGAYYHVRIVHVFVGLPLLSNYVMLSFVEDEEFSRFYE